MKITVILVSLILMASFCFAEVSSEERITELRQEAQELMNRRSEYMQVVNQIDIRLVEIQGVFKYLEKENEKENEKADLDESVLPCVMY